MKGQITGGLFPPVAPARSSGVFVKMAASGSFFAGVSTAKPVEVFQLTAEYNADPHPDKVNLTVGAYRTDDGKPWVLPVVRNTEAIMASDATLNKEYQPIAGHVAYCEEATKLLLGASSPAIRELRASSFQALGGTGALRLAAEALSNIMNIKVAYVTDPTWGNHLGIFRTAGMEVRQFKYWDEATRTMDWPSFQHALNTAPEGSVFILHAVAHNPTGIDPTREQWREIAAIMKARRLFPMFDIAYQGFASGDLEGDAWAVRYFCEQGFEMLVAQSFSKNFGLYNERVGNMVMVVADNSLAAPVRSHLELTVRRMYSNPPSHGARVVASVLNNPGLLTEWKENVQSMARRILDMRQQFYDRLRAQGTPGSWEHIITQTGMFSYTGINKEQVEILKREYHIYLMSSGRAVMCGLNQRNLDYVCKAIHEVLTRDAQRSEPNL